MKKKVLSLIITTVFGILTIIISGCATNRIDLVDTGMLSLEQHNTGKVYIAWSGAYEQDDGFGSYIRRLCSQTYHRQKLSELRTF